MNMFYSHLLVSKKGPLGTIWIAAHCHKKLKKDQVTQTNISSSVDKILLDEVPVVTYRILGYLLLGVVRIYSKKVEYLFHDCRDVLTEIRHFAGSRKAITHLGGMCAPQPARKKSARASTYVEAVCAPYAAITLPETFELDAFDLEVLEDVTGEHVKTHEEITVDDAWENNRTGCHSLGKDHCGEDSARFEDYSVAYTPLTDIPSPQHMDEDMVVRPSHNLSNSEASMEKLRDNRFSLEERLDPMILGEGEEESDFVRPFDKENQIDGKQKKSYVAVTFGEEKEPPEQNRSFDEEQHTNAENRTISEMTSIETEKLQVTQDSRPASIMIDVIPKSGVPSASGATTPEFMVVCTPAPKERARVLRKRKCVFDDIMVFPNKVLKEWIDDSSDLVCKRGKVPHTALLAWRAHRIFNLPQSFLEPLIPSVSLDFRSLICKKELETPKPVETPAKIGGLESPNPTIHGDLEEAAIAPSTPVTRSTSLRFNENRGISKSDAAVPASPLESIEKELSPSKDGELDNILMNEDLNSCEGDSQGNRKWSTRTRTVARYLHRNFLNREKRGAGEAVNLSRVLEGKTKKESARLFYELLVLKTGGYVDVKQNEAYDDISVLETLKLKKACESC